MILRDPALHLDPRVRRLWALRWLVNALVIATVFTITTAGLAAADRRTGAVFFGVLGGLASLAFVVLAAIQPGRAYRRFGYEITDLGLYVARGRLWRRWQVVPHARVQTVDTKRGPLERLFGLVSVEVTTASARGGTDVPGLDPSVADELVEELARRAGIDEGA